MKEQHRQSPREPLAANAVIPVAPRSVIIEAVTPELDGGRHPVKRVVGDVLTVEADVYREGHEPFTARLLWREQGEEQWQTTPMVFVDNDRHRASFPLLKNTRYEYTLEGWPDQMPEVVTRHDRVLEVVVDRPLARCAAWYEMWPRSQGKVPGRSATFDEMIARLPEISGMGFDVVYLTPIHPIGKTNRKGKNNAVKAQPGDPGCPYAVGNEAGGHLAVEPELGTLADFDRFVAACRARGLEVALDIAHTCSPDHPYAKTHPDWFYREADGTIKFAENPPKKYEDIYPFNFYSDDWVNLWLELKKIFEFWIGHGVTIFRVDNPHTKPVTFWSWVIREIQNEHPGVIFLAEAFTKPKMMKRLAKVGFTMSYTYFTWRNHKEEFIEYLTELTRTEMKEYYRGNFFTNTPDILPVHLQEGGRPAFKMRAALAATLSSLYGIYNGFELAENTPKVPGKEEYLNSEKYEYKVWDWDRPGNLKEYLALLNRIRRENPALQGYDNLTFYPADNDQVLFYGKVNPDRSNLILCVVSLDYARPQETLLHLPLGEWGVEPWQVLPVEELISGQKFAWKGETAHWKLSPDWEMAAIFRVALPARPKAKPAETGAAPPEPSRVELERLTT